jgi:hypothetical protein
MHMMPQQSLSNKDLKEAATSAPRRTNFHYPTVKKPSIFNNTTQQQLYSSNNNNNPKCTLYDSPRYCN